MTGTPPIPLFLKLLRSRRKGAVDTVTNGSIRTLELLSGNRRARTKFLGDDSGVEAAPTLIAPFPAHPLVPFFFFLPSVAEL